MLPKSNKKLLKNKKGSPVSSHSNFSKDSNIFETTYEKVLSIINKVKDFIKKNSKNSKKLIEDLEWVTKVIANKSLYSYEIKKPNLSRQNSEFNKFVNFVTKYNEEVIEMNQKHILVSGLLNIVKKGEILKKPSLCLKKILPEEFQNMDYEKEKEKKNRKKNLINLIGNAILNLYYKTIEKQKKEKEENNENNINNENNVNNENNNNNKNNDKKEEQNEIKIKIKLNYLENNNKKNVKEINKIDSKNIKNLPINNNIINSGNKIKHKLINFNTSSQSCNRRKHFSNINIKSTKNEKQTLNSIKNKMKNYYIKYALIEQNNSNEVSQYISKGNLVKNKNINSTKYYNSYLRIKSSFEEKSITNPYKYNKNNSQIYHERNKNQIFNIKYLDDINKKKIKNNYLNHLDSSNIQEYIDKSYIGKNSNILIHKKIHLSDYIKNKNNFNKTSITKPNLKDIKQQKLPNNEQNNNVPKISLNKLIEQYFNDMKNIIDKDFDLFDFKTKVGHRNVLPLMCHCILKTLGLLDKRIITLSKIESFLYSVNDNYKESTLYHNSLHGADVTQSLCVYFINSNAEQICETSVLDLLGMIISAMGHDLGHPGLTNNFHINASSDLALTYNDSSCLENYHCSFLFKILKKSENNIIENLSVENYKNIRKRMIRQILATDMANHGEVMSLIRTKIKLFKEQNEEEKDISKSFILLSGNEKTKFDEQQVLLNYLIHMADLGHNCKKYEISKKWIKLLCEEFWIQGDKEKSLGIPVSFLCDRDKKDVPASQVNFLRGFIISSFDSLVEMFPKLKYNMDNAHDNINTWQKLLEQKRVTGWTPKKEDKEEEKKEKQE